MSTPHGWQVMWGAALVIYLACKLLTWWEAGRPVSPLGAGYLLAWPGLDARTFLRGTGAVAPTRGDWALALAKIALGGALFYGLARAFPPFLAGWAGMVGVVFLLHFGLFDLLSCGWRALGVEAEPLMNWPIASRNLAEFWGRRWNTAFRHLTHRFLFRPIVKRVGPAHLGVAVLGSFAFSGLVHDAVISLPAGGGYGGPTLFFVLQGVGVILESRLRGALGGWKGRAYAAAFLILPVGLLFHRPFVLNIVVPFMTAAGALP